MERSTHDLESPTSPEQGQKEIGQGQLPQISQSEAEVKQVPMETGVSNAQTETNQSESSKPTSDNQPKSGTDAEQKSGRAHPPPLVRNMSTQILDFSDPLQNYQKSHDESIFERKGSLHEVTQNESKRYWYILHSL